MPAEPDLRFLEANERTLLAWIRTALGLLGLGFAIARARALLGDHPNARSSWEGVVLAGLAPWVLAVGVVRFRRAHEAILTGAPAPRGVGGLLGVSGVLMAVMVAAVVGLLLR